MKTTEYIILGIVVLISLIAAGFLIWNFAFRKHGNTQGESCKSNADCAAKHYCGGDGKCQAGTSGGASGTDCTVNSDCAVGLACVNDKCSSSVTPPDNNIGSFTDSSITIENNGKTQYLTLFPADSKGELGLSGWEDTEPAHSFTYSSSTNEMSVSGNITGSLFINALGAIETGTASKFFFVKQSDGNIRLEDGFTNPIKIEDLDGMGEGEGAIFIDLARYIDQVLTTKGSNTFVKIVKASS